MKSTKRHFLKKGLFELPLMRSRVKTETMSWKEKILGYLVGPFGTLALIAIINQLGELYYTEIFYIDQIFGVGTYLVMSWVTQAIGVVMGLVVAYIVERTVSSQGRIRPYVLIGSLICAVAGLCKFLIPDMPDAAKLVWVYFFNILYTCVGLALFNLKVQLQTLSTRNYKDRMQVNLIVQISAFLLVGVAVNMLVGSVLYYTMLHNFPAGNWIMLVGIISIVSVPLSVVHYYYTKERITLEDMVVKEKKDDKGQIEREAEENEQEKLTVWQQMKCLLKSKFWVMALVIATVIGVANCLVGANLSTNFCTVILGANAENNYNLIYTIASGVPLGLGILLVYPLCRKFSIRKVTIAFSIIAILGCVMGFIVKDNFILVVIANFIYNFGTLLVIYALGTLTQSSNDEVEYKYNFRPEGLMSGALIYAVVNILTGAFSGLYETGLVSNGYDPALDANQPAGVFSWLYFIRYGVPIIQYGILAVVLIFMTLEKRLPKMNEEIRLRRKAEAEARGEVYISPEERAEQERIEDERVSELARMDDLKAKCAKKGLDFETENAKYLALQEEKRRKREEKQAKNKKHKSDDVEPPKTDSSETHND